MQHGQRNVVVLFFTLVVVMIGFGVVIPILPYYVQHFGASGIALGLLMSTYGVMQFLCAPLWGQLSDRIGRRPVLLIGVLGTALAYLLFGLSTQLWMLYAVRALAGMLSSATLPTAMAYIGDSTAGDKRSGAMGMLGAAMGVGMVIGPGLGGWLGSVSLSMPFFLAAGLATASFLLILALVPESLPRSARATGKMSGIRLKPIWAALRGPLGTLFFMAFLLSFGLANFEGVFGLFAAQNYGYDSVRVGTILTVVGVVSAAIQGGLTGLLSRKLGEERVIRFSLLASSAAFLLMLTAGSFYTVLLTVGLFVASNALLSPAVSTLISKRTASGQGAAMGLNNSFQSLGRVAGPAWAGLIFDVNVAYPYVSGAIIMVGGFLWSLVALKSASRLKG